MMRFDIMTLFPDLVEYVLGESILGRAQKSGAIEVSTYQIRDFSVRLVYLDSSNKSPRHDVAV